MAFGLSSVPPSWWRNARAGTSVKGKVGAPCDRNRLGMVMEHYLRTCRACRAGPARFVSTRIGAGEVAERPLVARHTQRVDAIAEQSLNDQRDDPERRIFPTAMRVVEKEPGRA